MNYYDIIYLLTNIFGTYTIYKFMSVFFDYSEINKKLEMTVYILYFFLIGTIHIFFNQPITNVISNLILFLLITSIYTSTFKVRLTAVICIYAILISVETVTIIFFSLLNLNQYIYSIDIELILSLIISKIVSYTVVLVISNLKMLKSGTQITSIQWFAVICIPFGTLFSTFVLMTESNDDNYVQIFISIAILFLINFFVFYLYDVLIQSYQEKLERDLLKQQSNAYYKQLKLITASQDNIKILRHDLKLHMSTLQGLIETSNDELALAYIQNTYSLTKFSNEYAKSCNVELDSILNYKIYEAEKLEINVTLNLSVPEKFNIQPIDIVNIIGNLLDNAIEAASKLKQGKEIKISIEFSRSILYFNIINSYDGTLLVKNKKLKTTHIDKENHGLGLQSVQNSLDKYFGSMSIEYTDTNFCVKVLMYDPIIN